MPTIKQKEYARKYYEEHRNEIIKRASIWTKKNKNKIKKYQQEFHKRHKDEPKYQERLKNNWKKARLKRFNITPEEYADFIKQQNGVCAICEKTNTVGTVLCVDHDHKTGEIRGLLCHKCNSAIGLFNDDVLLLWSALGYLAGYDYTKNKEYKRIKNGGK